MVLPNLIFFPNKNPNFPYICPTNLRYLNIFKAIFFYIPLLCILILPIIR